MRSLLSVPTNDKLAPAQSSARAARVTRTAALKRVAPPNANIGDGDKASRSAFQIVSRSLSIFLSLGSFLLTSFDHEGKQARLIASPVHAARN